MYLSKDSNGVVYHKTIINRQEKFEEWFNNDGELYLRVIKEFDENGRLIKSTEINNAGGILREDEYEYNGSQSIWKHYERNRLSFYEENKVDENLNPVSAVRRDQNDQVIDWIKLTYDKYNNEVYVTGGNTTDVSNYELTIVILYFDED